MIFYTVSFQIERQEVTSSNRFWELYSLSTKLRRVAFYSSWNTMIFFSRNVIHFICISHYPFFFVATSFKLEFNARLFSSLGLRPLSGLRKVMKYMWKLAWESSTWKIISQKALKSKLPQNDLVYKQNLPSYKFLSKKFSGRRIFMTFYL